MLWMLLPIRIFHINDFSVFYAISCSLLISSVFSAISSPYAYILKWRKYKNKLKKNELVKASLRVFFIITLSVSLAAPVAKLKVLQRGVKYKLVLSLKANNFAGENCLFFTFSIIKCYKVTSSASQGVIAIAIYSRK